MRQAKRANAKCHAGRSENSPRSAFYAFVGVSRSKKFAGYGTISDSLFLQGVELIGWILSAMVMFSVVYGLYPGNLTVLASSVYASLGHTAWAMAVAFIVIQCCTGSARMIDSLLSLKLMYPLSRLTYCAYLVHPVIMMITCTQMDGPLHLHNGIVVRRKEDRRNTEL